ncbi:MAG: hypothetical protein K4571_07265 [Deltaproteobacteria bacterium]
MKKILCLCLMLSLLVACSSEKDVKPNPAASPAAPDAAAPAAPEPMTGLSGEYVLTETSAKKTKWDKQEYTCHVTHTYTLQFIDDQMVRYTAKTDQSIDPPAEGMMCFTKLYNVDTTGTYKIKDGTSVMLTFAVPEGKMPWVHKNIMLLRLKNASALEIVNNGSEFRKQ